jgi:hypothetical protein
VDRDPQEVVDALSPQIIDVLADIISGSSASDPVPPVGLCRSGWEIERFLKAAGVDFTVGGGSWLSSLRDRLLQLRDDLGEDPDSLLRLIERVVEDGAAVGDTHIAGAEQQTVADVSAVGQR